MEFIKQIYYLIEKILQLDKLGLDYYALIHPQSSIHKALNFMGNKKQCYVCKKKFNYFYLTGAVVKSAHRPSKRLR